MIYQLKKELQVYVETDTTGAYEARSEVNVSFTGKKGLQTLKRLQDVIFKTFAQQSKGDTAQKQEAKKQDSVVEIDEVLNILEMTGASEMLFDEVTGALKGFGTIAGTKLTDSLIDSMDIEDLDGLYQEVLKHFLLPKITQKMNSMNK
jgi:tRNA U34 5-carboxymethylaminomethyl modifying GTPase MnmE/TrmE